MHSFAEGTNSLPHKGGVVVPTTSFESSKLRRRSLEHADERRYELELMKSQGTKQAPMLPGSPIEHEYPHFTLPERRLID